MRTGHYTRLKGRVTYFRRKIPDFLQEQLASTEICYRLGVISSSLAERLGRRLAVEIDDFFERAKTDPMLNDVVLTKLVETALAGWREDDAIEASNDIRTYGRPFLEPKEQAKAWAQLALGLISQVGNGESAYDDAFVADVARKAGIAELNSGAEVDAGGRALSLGLAAHYLRSAIAMTSMPGLGPGLNVADWRKRLAELEKHLGVAEVSLDRTKPTVVEPPQPSPLAHHALDPDPVTKPAVVGVDPSNPPMPFSDFVDMCLTIRIANNEVSEDQREEMQSSRKIWTQTVGDLPITAYDRSSFLAFRAVLQQVPTYYWKSKASQSLNIQEVIDWARADARAKWAKSGPAEKINDAASIERASSSYTKISNTTINRHLSTIAPVFEWAMENHYLPENTRIFWNNLHLPTGQKVTGLKPNQERPAYSHQQIQSLSKHPVWMGRRSDYFYNSPGDVIIRDGLYWSFPIALLHGLRREEFSQLGVRHVRSIDDVWVFDFHAHDLKLKNGPSRRYVPLHSWMLKLGFIEAMVAGRDPRERLFAELSAEGNGDKFGDALGKKFARVVDHTGIVVIRKNSTESDGGYHPLRHRFITDLLGAGVREGIVDYLSGHASGARERERERSLDGERERYTEDPPVRELKEAIDRLPVSVDFQSWLDAWQSCRGRGKSGK